MEGRLFHKRDIIILTALCVAAVFILLFTSRDKGEAAEVWVNGEMYRSYKLGEPFELTLDNGVMVSGDGETARFVDSDCTDKVCVSTGKLSAEGQWAACLPNRTVLKITKGGKELDTVS